MNNVSVELRGTRLTAEVSGDRLRDPVAVQSRDLPAASVREVAVGAAARGSGAAADNMGAAALYRPVTKRIATAEPGRLLPGHSDELDGATVPGTEAGSPWQWVRGPATGVTMPQGALSRPTQDAELHLGDNTAPVLLRDAPAGDYTVEDEAPVGPRPGCSAGRSRAVRERRPLVQARPLRPSAH
ncbi:hypothetical protein [Streptomyces sp. NPDC053728]|uniref:hypothetical protein n=1 Tax=Streptomyces sp. NPDC053728 TaxID=3155534 RepID=UPI0034347F56